MAIWRPVVCVLIGQPHAENRSSTSHVTVSRREILRWTYPELRAVMEEGEGTIQVKSFGSVSGKASLEGTHYISPLLSIWHILTLTNCLLCARHYLGWQGSSHEQNKVPALMALAVSWLFCISTWQQDKLCACPFANSCFSLFISLLLWFLS